MAPKSIPPINLTGQILTVTTSNSNNALDKAIAAPLQVKSRKDSAGSDNIYIARSTDALYQALTVSFKRTVRVSDDGKPNELPPDLGAFPIYRKEEYGNLPQHLAGRTGFFIPMYQREAMRSNFIASQPFAVKIYVGGANAVSSEETTMKRLKLMEKKNSVQDYVAVPGQLWLDGVVGTDGCVRQFVAMPLGSGYSVEAQIKGEETVGGLQFEVTPSKQFAKLDDSEECCAAGAKLFPIFVKIPEGNIMRTIVAEDDYVEDLQISIEKRQGMPVDHQRLLFRGKQIESHERIRDLGIGEDCTVQLFVRGLGGSSVKPDMGLAAGGLIKQTVVRDPYHPRIWDLAKTATVSILNSESFKQITGCDAPPTPITAQTYADHAYPYFSIFKEVSSSIGGRAFEKLKSVKQIR